MTALHMGSLVRWTGGGGDVVTGGASGWGSLLLRSTGCGEPLLPVLEYKGGCRSRRMDELLMWYYKCDVGNRHEVEAIARRIEDDVSEKNNLLYFSCMHVSIR